MKNDSFFSALFDTSFTKYTSRSFLRVLYIIACIVVGLNLLGYLASIWLGVSFLGSLGENSEDLEKAMEMAVPGQLLFTAYMIFQSLINLVVIRIVLEVFAALVNIAGAWGRIDQRGARS